jgi:hemoglobin-like flavoprotein
MGLETDDHPVRIGLGSHGAEQMSELARIFNDSYERVTRPSTGGGEFFAAFYQLLITTDAEAASKFRNTDMPAQVRMLKASVAILLNFFATGHLSDSLARLAKSHSKLGADIPPRLYSVWLDCLVETVRRFDPKFNDEVANAWRVVFSKGIEYMTSRYEAG